MPETTTLNLTLNPPPTHDRFGREITTGVKVRSFSFPDQSRATEGEDACFVEGEVLGVEDGSFECPRYVIRVSRHVFGGKEVEGEDFVFPPLNGTRTLFGGTCNGVEVLPEYL